MGKRSKGVNIEIDPVKYEQCVDDMRQGGIDMARYDWKYGY